jgi:hypothetical protein
VKALLPLLRRSRGSVVNVADARRTRGSGSA